MEKSYELLKQKSSTLEDQTRELQTQNAKLADDLHKAKQSKQKMTKEFNELKQSSQNLKIQDLLQQSAAELDVKPQKEEAKTTSQTDPNQSILQATRLTSIIVQTLSQTLPLMMSPVFDGDDDQSTIG